MTWLPLPLALLFGAAPASAAPPVTAVTFTPDGKEVVVGSQAGLEVRTWPDLKPDRAMKTELDHVHDLAFSPDGKTLAAVGGTPARRGTVELFRWPGGELIRRFSPHRDLVYAVDWRADSAAVATAGADGIVGIHPTAGEGGSRKLEGHSRGVLAAVFLPGDAGLLTAGVDASLRLWDPRAGGVIRTLSNHTLPVHDLAVRPGGGGVPPLVVSVSDDRTVRFWQPTVGRLVRFVRLEAVPLAVAWTADGGAAVVACKDGRVRVIDPDTAELLGDRPGLEGVAYSLAVAPDGSVLVGGQGGQLRRVAIK
jgi:WD40 repeat protein